MATTEQANLPKPPAPPAPPAPAPAPAYTPVPKLTQGQATTAAPAPASTAGTASASYVGVGDKQTVQGQLKGIIDQNSPLMQQAATTAKQGMASRGLVNSSMAVGAGQNAVIGAAMPIAQQDANTYAQAHQQNAAMATDVSKTNASLSTQNNQFNSQLTQQNNQFNAQAKDDMTKFNISGEASMLKQGMDADTRVQLANIEANYQTLMQSTQSAGTLYSQMLTNISNIQNNKDMDAAAKNAAVAAQYAYLENGMNLIASMNNLDLGDLLKFDVPPPKMPPGAPAPPPPGGGPGGGNHPPGGFWDENVGSA